MGNNLSYENDGWFEVEDDSDTDFMFPEVADLHPHLDHALGEFISGIMGNLAPALGHMPTTMPVIRKKPDLSTFRHTSLYREIKALCGLPANSRRPNERWSLMRELAKRENGISAFTPNKQRRIANIYVPNEKEERLMSLDSTKLFICTFNNDGSKLITAGNDSIVRIFNSSKGTYHRINRLKAKDINWSIVDIDCSPCGEYFAYSTWSDYFFVMPMGGTAEDCQFYELGSEQSRCGIFSIRFSPDGRTLIGGCNNSCIYMCDRETRAVKSIQTERNFQLDINSVAYVSNQDSNVFISGCDNGVLKLWDARCIGGGDDTSGGMRTSRHTPVGTFIGHMDGITYIDPRNDGTYVLSNSKDQSIKIWDLRKTTPRNKIKRTNNSPLTSWDYRWDSVPREYYNPPHPLDGDVSVMTYRGHRVTKSLIRAKFSPAAQTGQRYIYTGCATGRIIIYDVLTGCIREAIEGHKDIVRDLSWHPVRAEIISCSWDSHVNLNVFKRNQLLKRTSTGRRRRPVRRSRRIATQNGELEDDEEDDVVSSRF